MQTYQTAKFDSSPNNLLWDIVLTDRWPEQKKKKKKERIRIAKTIDLHLHADLNSGTAEDETHFLYNCQKYKE